MSLNTRKGCDTKVKIEYLKEVRSSFSRSLALSSTNAVSIVLSTVSAMLRGNKSSLTSKATMRLFV